MKRDLKDYYVTLQRQFKEMKDMAEKVNKEIQEGKLTQEQRDAFETYFMNVKTNYDRVSYIIYLLDLPPKFIQKIMQWKEKRDYDKWYKENFKENKATAEDVINENEESLSCAREELSKICSEGCDE